MKRAPKRWQIFSQEIVILRLDGSRERRRDVLVWRRFRALSRCLKPVPWDLVLKQLFGHFLVAEALDFCADGG
jgi:hypothetical protein